MKHTGKVLHLLKDAGVTHKFRKGLSSQIELIIQAISSVLFDSELPIILQTQSANCKLQPQRLNYDPSYYSLRKTWK